MRALLVHPLPGGCPWDCPLSSVAAPSRARSSGGASASSTRPPEACNVYTQCVIFIDIRDRIGPHRPRPLVSPVAPSNGETTPNSEGVPPHDATIHLAWLLLFQAGSHS